MSQQQPIIFSRSPFQLPVLNGFRALFILLVANFHIWQQSWMHPTLTLGTHALDLDFLARSGYVFVDGMVLISALLLFLPWVASTFYPACYPPRKDFLWHKVARILPSYYVVIAVLFVYMCAVGRYNSLSFALEDLLSHIFLVHTFIERTYFNTKLFAGLWTVVILVQGYLLMPLLWKLIKKHTLVTLMGMCLAAFVYRFAVAHTNNPWFYLNQLPAFLDVYALGYILATIFVHLHHKGYFAQLSLKWQLLATIALSLTICILICLLKIQANSNGLTHIVLNQLKLRLPFSVVFAMLMLFASLSLKPIQWLFSNRLMLYLSTISYNFYMCHQVIAVEYRLHLFNTETLHATRNLQIIYTLLCWSTALIVASFLTFFVEKPMAKFILTHISKSSQSEAL